MPWIPVQIYGARFVLSEHEFQGPGYPMKMSSVSETRPGGDRQTKRQGPTFIGRD